MTVLMISFFWILLMMLGLSINLLAGKPPIRGGCNSLLCRQNCQGACPHRNSGK